MIAAGTPAQRADRITGVVLALALAGCGGGAPACPEGTRSDDARALEIRTRLASVVGGAELVRDAVARVRAICFAPATSASVIDDTFVVILQSDLEPGEAAARLGHLLVHVRDGLPSALLHGPDCGSAVERALAREATAYVREVALQAELGAAPRALAFEFAADVLAAAPERREPIVLDYLRAHPGGAPGIDGLAAGYRARCEAGPR